MTPHEQERIADAMSHLRPDWPARQLKTLLADARLAERPRRDVAVALAWVACEPASASPYRVLEAGPWWKAAGIEGQAHPREPFDASAFCGTCGEPQPRCQLKWSTDHQFESVAHSQVRHANDETDVPRVIGALKAELVPTKAATEPTERKRDPHVEQVRELLHTDTRAPDGEMEETNR